MNPSSPPSVPILPPSYFTKTVVNLNILTDRRPNWQARRKRCSGKIIQRKILTNRLSLAKAAERKG